MDTSKLGQGEKIAAASGIALLIVMSIFDWFGEGPFGLSAWQSFGLIDLVLLLTAGAAIALAVMSANSQSPNLPVAGSALIAGLGILSVILIAFRILSPPDFGFDGADLDRQIGVFLGLIAAAGVAYGGWRSMQEEGTSFSEQADRVQDRNDPPAPGPGAPPPVG